MTTEKSLDTENFRSLLLQAHLGAQRGFYFDEIKELESGPFIAFSQLLADPYWNFAIATDQQLQSQDTVSALKQEFTSKSRHAAILAVSGVEEVPITPKNASLVAEEVWMTVSRSDLIEPEKTKLTFEKISTETQISTAVDVFSDAYTTETIGEGYSSLPPEYSHAFRRGLSRAQQFGSIHLLGVDDGIAVATASVFFSNNVVGLYNVAVTRQARGRGYGSRISFEALSVAFGMGASECFLQTEPRSVVERLYSRLGFHTRFTGKYFTLN